MFRNEKSRLRFLWQAPGERSRYLIYDDNYSTHMNSQVLTLAKGSKCCELFYLLCREAPSLTSCALAKIGDVGRLALDEVRDEPSPSLQGCSLLVVEVVNLIHPCNARQRP